jgi:2-isopropylmalate synthase
VPHSTDLPSPACGRGGRASGQVRVYARRQKRDVARALRRNSTDAERIIWRLLRDRRLDGVKFRRQVPIGPFVADFASVEHRLVVELDGGQHAESKSDALRDSFLAANGWRVVRFWNNEVMRNREGVWESIQRALALTPTLSRKRERE